MKWRSGPPPSKGWWIASMCYDQNVLRWWSGRSWSQGIHHSGNSKEAAFVAGLIEPAQQIVKWLPRPKSWPERSKT